MSLILAFETSCDDTAVAVVDNNGIILANIIYSQTEHQKFGGIVPEIGSRSHIEQIHICTLSALQQANIHLEQIDAIAATFAPGLLGPLLVGAQYAKGLAASLNKPLIAIHHIEGHILSGYLQNDFLQPPFISLIASGGHTALYQVDSDYSMKTLGQTLDDAAGEAFDKIGRSLGFAYPAGKIISEWAKKGDKNKFAFSIPMIKNKSLNFSFSGLKTKALEFINKLDLANEYLKADFCASLQEVICLSLIDKTFLALEKTSIKSLVLGGGVTANERLRELITAKSLEKNINLFLPPISICTDNAVMIARAAHLKLSQHKISSLKQDAFACLPIEESYKLHG